MPPVPETAPAEAPVSPGLSAAHKQALKAALKRTRRDRARPPGQADALAAAAVNAVNAERYEEGLRLALKALVGDTQSLAACLAGAVALDHLGRLQEALEFYAQAVALSPQDAVIAGLLGGVAHRQRELDLAERFLRVAIALDAKDPSHVANLGGVLRDQGRFDEAIALLRPAILAAPATPDLWNTLGTVCQEQGSPEEAVTFIAEAVRLKPVFARGYHNLGSSLTDLARYREACEALDHAVRDARSIADRTQMRHARAMARFGAGRLEEGWEDYAARLHPSDPEALGFQTSRARWSGQPLAGRHLLILGEQGLGDEVLFMNAAPDAIAAAGQVTIACEARLVSLFQRSFPAARVIAHATGRSGSRKVRMLADPEGWEGVEYWAPMADVAAAFRPKVAAFPVAGAFLTPDPERVRAIAAAIAHAPGLKIGIAWKSLVMTPKRARYFAPFSLWEPVLRRPGTSVFSLQYGDTEAEAECAREKWGVELRAIPDLDLRDDLEGVAAAGVALDLVIAPMNASSNLAAACGGAVWFVHRYGSWTMLGTDGSPWYPTSRTFTGGPEGRWETPFAAAAAALAETPAPRGSGREKFASLNPALTLTLS